MATLKNPFRSNKLPPGAGPPPQGETLQPPSGGVLGAMFGGGGDSGGSGWNNGIDDDPRSRINKLGALMMMLDPMTANAGTSMLQLEQNRAATSYATKRQNQTAQWLTTQGLGGQEAAYLASDPAALKEWYTQWNAKKYPKWEMHEVFNDKGQKVQVMMDMNTGKYSPVGGAEAPTLSVESGFDDQGRENKFVFNHNDGSRIPLGASKTDVVSPEAEEQKIKIARAGATPGPNAYDTEVGGERGFGGKFNRLMQAGDTADAQLGRLSMMEKDLDDPNFKSGGGEGSLMAKQWAQYLGFDQKGIEKMEDFEAQSRALALDAMGGKLGAGFSNDDRNFIRGLIPSLANSKAGLKTLITVQKALAQRNKQLKDMALNYVNDPDHPRLDAGFERQMNKWGEANPIFTPELQKQLQDQAKIPDVNTPVEQHTPPPPGGGGNTPGAVIINGFRVEDG